jgi:hypothetical protein
MPRDTQNIISEVSGGLRDDFEIIQQLWGGYGNVIRVPTPESDRKSVVVKHMKITSGLEMSVSQTRKLRSYQVELAFYKSFAQLLPKDKCLVPALLDTLVSQKDGVHEVLLVLEDLSELGYSLRKTRAEWNDVASCLQWLANFHATFLGVPPVDLWETGTYWHLETRLEEFAALPASPLKEAAHSIDNLLRGATFQTILHGDAKIANFCFANADKSCFQKVGAVDFQYAGLGCGMKDVAYFAGSCLNGDQCELLEDQILETYFSFLRKAIDERRPDLHGLEAKLESEWRKLYHVAWADFVRFLKGWQPDHWKLHDYGISICDGIVSELV